MRTKRAETQRNQEEKQDKTGNREREDGAGGEGEHTNRATGK